MVKRKKRGPPKLSANEKRLILVTIKSNRAEYAAMKAAAGPLPLATWARIALMAAATKKGR